jgi:hypothetical protein
MTHSDPPNLAVLLAPVIARVPASAQHRFLGLLERGAAERYRQWAASSPEHRAGLLECAAREEETAERVETLPGCRCHPRATERPGAGGARARSESVRRPGVAGAAARPGERGASRSGGLARVRRRRRRGRAQHPRALCAARGGECRFPRPSPRLTTPAPRSVSRVFARTACWTSRGSRAPSYFATPASRRPPSSTAPTRGRVFGTTQGFETVVEVVRALLRTVRNGSRRFALAPAAVRAQRQSADAPTGRCVPGPGQRRSRTPRPCGPALLAAGRRSRRSRRRPPTDHPAA